MEYDPTSPSVLDDVKDVFNPVSSSGSISIKDAGLDQIKDTSTFSSYDYSKIPDFFGSEGPLNYDDRVTPISKRIDDNIRLKLRGVEAIEGGEGRVNALINAGLIKEEDVAYDTATDTYLVNKDGKVYAADAPNFRGGISRSIKNLASDIPYFAAAGLQSLPASNATRIPGLAAKAVTLTTATKSGSQLGRMAAVGTADAIAETGR